MLDQLTTIILGLAAAIEFVIIVACLIVISDEIRRLKTKISENDKELKELKTSNSVQFCTLADTINEMDKRKVDRWDNGKNYWNTQDWDEHK